MNHFDIVAIHNNQRAMAAKTQDKINETRLIAKNDQSVQIELDRAQASLDSLVADLDRFEIVTPLYN